MKLSDWVAGYLARREANDVFLVAGGGIMHLLDSIGRHPGLRYFSTYHEQAAVVAAEGYARRTGRIGVALVTVGPGAANAVAGLPGAWVDSVPLIVLAGQVRRDLIANYRVQRQYGPQEANTLDMARPVCKYAVSLRDPKQVRAVLDEAFRHATTGRPGPVWVEFPLDVQGAEIDEAELETSAATEPPRAAERLAADVHAVVEILRKAERPLIVPGNGVRSEKARTLLAELLERTSIPVAVPFTAKDLVPECDPRYVGVFGTAGQRRANFAVQNCDALLAVGAGLNVQKIGFNCAGFAASAVKAVVDVDPVQLERQALEPDLGVVADASAFLEELLRRLEGVELALTERWLAACARWKERYPTLTPDAFRDVDHVNSYVFMDALSDAVRGDDTLVVGAGLDAVSAYQAFRVRAGQRVLITGWGSMGWDLPLAVGASIGSNGRVVVAVGDGSIQWNLQELMTIARYRLPVKIFVFNNAGFGSIRATQNAFFGGKLVGSDPESGVANPDFAKLAEAYGLRHVRARTNGELAEVLPAFLADNLPAICELNIAAEQSISPKASTFRRPDGTFESRPLEDMAPFLPREEVFENMNLFSKAESQA